jgi:hypothetical protein
MVERRTGPERLSAFSDAVFAVITTVPVLDLRPPSADTFSALLSLWPIGLSYAVSYLFIAIVWVNHHHLFTHAEESTPRLVWSNFAHLFSVSLIPFTTEWIAESRLGGSAGGVLRRRLRPRQRHLSGVVLGSRRSAGGGGRVEEGAPDVAHAIVHHGAPVRRGGSARTPMAGGGDGSDLRLPDRLCAAGHFGIEG